MTKYAEKAGTERSRPLEEVELTILMPCLNEEETVGECVRKARDFLQEHRVQGEVIVSDNGSTDRSAELAKQAGARVVHVRAIGYGNAILGGLETARGRYIIMGDADASYDFSNLKDFLDKLREGYDLVMGNRFVGGIEAGAMPKLHRYVGNPLLTIIGRMFFGSPVRDFHCGLRAFSKEAAERMNLQTGGMEFASEMVAKASLLRMKVVEVPVRLRRAGRSRPPHLRSFRDGWRHLRFMLIYTPRWLYLYPGLSLMLAGSGVGGWLLPGPREVGEITLDIHTLIYAFLAVLIGFQAILFALFAKIFGVREGLLPPDTRLDQLERYFSLELVLTVGTIFLVSGIGGTIFSVWQWQQTAFGELNPSETLRTIIPAMLALVLGCQIILGSFFVSILKLHQRSFEVTES